MRAISLQTNHQTPDHMKRKILVIYLLLGACCWYLYHIKNKKAFGLDTTKWTETSADSIGISTTFLTPEMCEEFKAAEKRYWSKRVLPSTANLQPGQQVNLTHLLYVGYEVFSEKIVYHRIPKSATFVGYSVSSLAKVCPRDDATLSKAKYAPAGFTRPIVVKIDGGTQITLDTYAPVSSGDWYALASIDRDAYTLFLKYEE